jgi:hypothetical protein
MGKYLLLSIDGSCHLAHFPVCCWTDWLLIIKNCLIESGPPCILQFTSSFLQHSAFNRNEYHKQNKCFWGVKSGQCVGLTILLPSVSRLSRQCGILNISQPYRRPRPVTEIALLFFLYILAYHRIPIMVPVRYE